MDVAVIFLGLFLFMALVTLYDWRKDRRGLFEANGILHRMLSRSEKKYAEQSKTTAELVETISPLIEQTDWLGPQPYNSGGLPALQAKEAKRNKEIVRIRGLVMSLPAVHDTFKLVQE